MEGTGQWGGWLGEGACESSAMACSALQRVPGSRELTLQPSVPSTPPPAPFSFEAGGKGGWQERGVEASQPTSECPFLLRWLPTLAWPTGPHKALPVSLATPHPTPMPLRPWADREGIGEAHRMNMEQTQDGHRARKASQGRQTAVDRMQVAPCGGSAGLWLSPAGLGHGAAFAHSIAHPSCYIHPRFPDASLTPSALLLQSQFGPWGFGPNTHILHTYWTCTCNHTESVTIMCTLWMKAHSSLCVTMATQQV